MNDPIPGRAVTGFLRQVLAALDTAEPDPARAAHVATPCRASDLRCRACRAHRAG